MKESLYTLEFDKILNILQSYAHIEVVKERILNLRYSSEKEYIEEELAKTDEAMKVITKYGNYSFGYIHNILSSVEKASKQGVLNCEELYRIGSQVLGVQYLKSYYSQVNEDEFPKFAYYLNSLVELKFLKNHIDKVVGSDLTVLDTASANLGRIRKEINKKNLEIRKKMDSLLKSNVSYLSDSLITVRNDRLVLPVKAAYKNMVNGIIQDESSSLQTCFIEPSSIVAINNEIASLRFEEKEEIERILRALSKEVAQEAPTLTTNFELLCELDFMVAKGSYGLSYSGLIAIINDTKKIELKGAKHPLISKDKVIANDFLLGDNNPSVYLITGPNTGGKTVALKLVGLLCMMSQVGLAIPVNHESTLPIFDEFFVDIGDDQDLQESLSTFSSHMSKLTYMIENCTEKSLIILDEIGGGTDPIEGEALAMASLEYFHNKGCITLASTHYDNLKSFAVEQDYILNVSMMFDEDNLHPTYRLLKGVSGRSYGFEIAEGLNYPKTLIKRAKEFKEKYQTEASVLTEKLEKELIHSSNIQARLDKREEELNKAYAEFEKKEEKLRLEKQELEEKAAILVQQKVEKYIEEVDEIIKDLKTNPDKKLHNAIEAKTKIKNMFEEDEEVQESLANTEVKVGDKVEILSINKVGIVESVSKDSCSVLVSGKSLKVKLSGVKKTAKKTEKVSMREKHEFTMVHVKAECNLIGLHVDEALPELQRYIDSCIRINLKKVRIIHGYGTGALKDMVWNYLKTCKYVKSYTFGGAYDGGMGATVVEFK